MITEVPRWPGVGPWSNQPARNGCVSGGTAMAPPACRPSWITLARTPIAGTSTETGSDLAIGAAAAGGIAAVLAGPVAASAVGARAGAAGSAAGGAVRLPVLLPPPGPGRL